MVTNQGRDVFVLKLDASGSAVVYSTYLGSPQETELCRARHNSVNAEMAPLHAKAINDSARSRNMRLGIIWRHPPATLPSNGEPPWSDSWIPEHFLTFSGDPVRLEAKFAVSICPE